MDDNPYSPQHVHKSGNVIQVLGWRTMLSGFFVMLGVLTLILVSILLLAESDLFGSRFFGLNAVKTIASRLILLASGLAWVLGGIAISRRKYARGFSMAVAALATFVLSILVVHWI